MNKALYAIIACAVIAGSNGVLIKQLSDFPAGAIAFFRTMVPVLFLLPVLFSKSKPLFTGNYRKMLLASTINVVRLYLYILAFLYTSIGNAVVLVYTWPIFVFLLESRQHKKPLQKEQVLLLLLAFTGMIITYSNKTFSFESNDMIGMVAAILCALGYAITIVMFKSESHYYTQKQTIIWQNLVSSVFFIPFMFFLPEVEVSQIGLGVFYGFWIGIVVFMLFFFALKHLPASTASGLMYIEILSAIALGYFIRNETLSIHTIIGGILILISSFLITRMNVKKR